MATLEEERRRRLLEDLIAKQGSRRAPQTEDYLKHISRLLARQQGVAKPTDAGKGYYAPPLTRYVDPRDKYAGTGMSGVANLLGGILQPGRASAIGAMNRQHLVSLPQQQAQQSALLTDTQLEGLKQKALDPNATPEDRAIATKYISAYMQAMKPPSYGSGGGANAELYRRLAQEGGVAGKDDLGIGERIGGAPGTDDATTGPPLTSVLPGSLTLSEARDRVETDIAEKQAQIDALDRELESLGVEGTTRTRRLPSISASDLYGLEHSGYGESYQVPIDLDWIAKRKKEIPIEKAKLAKDKSTLEEHRRPAAGAGTATTAPRNQ